MVQLEKVNFKYHNNLVLKDINLIVNKADYMGIIGANGSSKSTLVKVILGILTPLSGDIKLFGQSQKDFTDWHKIGYVRQNANVINQQFPASVYEIVKLGLYPIKKKLENPEQKIEKILKLVGAWDYKDSLIGELSGGQQQKVFIARALISKPELLILDEATVGIDVESKKEFYAFLKQMNREYGLTIIIISHEQNMLLQDANRLIIMEAGRAKEISPQQYKAGALC